jgi:hypothetical protein
MTVKIRIQNVLLLALLLVVASASFAQTAPAVNAAANRSWPSFWREFSAAINKKDVAALRKLMPDDFFDGGRGCCQLKARSGKMATICDSQKGAVPNMK